MKSSSVFSIKLLDVDLLVERHTTNSFFLMCDLICVVVTPHVNDALIGNVEDAMISSFRLFLLSFFWQLLCFTTGGIVI